MCWFLSASGEAEEGMGRHGSGLKFDIIQSRVGRHSYPFLIFEMDCLLEFFRIALCSAFVNGARCAPCLGLIGLAH